MDYLYLPIFISHPSHILNQSLSTDWVFFCTQLLHEEVTANPPAAANVQVGGAVADSPTASSGSDAHQPALPGWEDRIMSAVNTPAGTQPGSQQGQFWSREQQMGDSAESRSISLGTSHQSLQKLESGLLPQVFSTRDSFDPPGEFGSIPRSQEERDPQQAALAAQAITAQVC